MRRLPSGRWQAHYTIEESGERRLAPITFTTKDEADGWLSTVRADMLRGTWRDPLIGDITLAAYFPKWLAARPKLKPRTVALYQRLAAHWLIPAVGSGDSTAELGATPLRRITTKTVREWNAIVVREARGKVEAKGRGKVRRHPAREWAQAQGIEVTSTGRLKPSVIAAWEAAGRPDVRPAKPIPANAGQATAAQCYRLLHAIMATAVEDDLISVNPCMVKGASSASVSGTSVASSRTAQCRLPSSVVTSASGVPRSTRTRAPVFALRASPTRHRCATSSDRAERGGRRDRRSSRSPRRRPTLTDLISAVQRHLGQADEVPAPADRYR
ncbi:Lsr2 family DNA-binding protein [Catenulispora pinistramenti]|uniref:Lsr2 family DNA-binding protein n=1 Tax=Catenulispora pinistramenti TaxID=2705254 RepID=UPI001E5E1888|nr:hypothetical protein [Catenulispora pinistramenti]